MRNIQSNESRRLFLKSSAASAAGIMVCGLSSKTAEASAQATPLASAWKKGMNINPMIDNLRTVMARDTAMVVPPDGAMIKYNIEGQNAYTDKTRVQDNLDKMAIALAEPESGHAKDAWAKIFHKPDNKKWTQTRVAIKVNVIDANDFPRLSILDKLMKVLMELGVLTSNITIYDGSPASAGFSKIEQYKSVFARANLPEGYKVETWVGGETKVLLGTEISCCKGLADGAIDILINVGLNKGHSITSFTLSMKNHIGSLVGHHEHYNETSLVPFGHRLAALNQSEAILGGSPVRQQLCLIDALHSMKGGPHGRPTLLTNTLLMGTHSPVVDYMTVKHIRENQEIMGVQVSHDTPFLKALLEPYDLDINSDLIKNTAPVDALKYKPNPNGARPPLQTESITVILGHNAYPNSVSIPLNTFKILPRLIEIYNPRGRRVAELSPNNQKRLVWNRKFTHGAPVQKGQYYLRASDGQQWVSRTFQIQ